MNRSSPAPQLTREVDRYCTPFKHFVTGSKRSAESRQVPQITQALAHVWIHGRSGDHRGNPARRTPGIEEVQVFLGKLGLLRDEIRRLVRIQAQIIEGVVAVRSPDH